VIVVVQKREVVDYDLLSVILSGPFHK
jgi:hypothetical protein